MSLANPKESKVYLPPPPAAPAASQKVAILALIGVMILGAILRWWWLSTVDTQPVTDFSWYFKRATEIASGLGYQVNGKQTAYWPVGYPAFLSLFFAIFGHDISVAKALNFLLTWLAIPLTFLVTQRLFRSYLTAVLAAFIIAIHPSLLAYSGILASDPLSSFLVLAGSLILLYARNKKWPLITAGIIFGLAVLVRPQSLLVPFIVLAANWRFDDVKFNTFKPLRASAFVLGAMLVVLAPWLIRNVMVFHQFVFVSTNGGDNLLIGHNKKATGRYMNPDKCGLARPAEMDEVARDKAASRAGMGFIKQHPGDSLRLVGPKLQAAFLTSTDAPYWAFQKNFDKETPPGIGEDKPLYKGFKEYSASFQWLLLTLFGVGLVLTVVEGFTNKRRFPFPVTPLALILYGGLIVAVFFGNPRFVFWLIPYMAMYAAHVPTCVLDRLALLKPIEQEKQATSGS